VTAAYVVLAALTLLLLAAVATVLGSAASHYFDYRRQRTFQRFLIEFRSQMRQQARESRRPETEQGLDPEDQRQRLRQQRGRVLGELMGSAGE
jgi:membrane protein YqaA with SNARE-associated domain